MKIYCREDVIVEKNKFCLGEWRKNLKIVWSQKSGSAWVAAWVEHQTSNLKSWGFEHHLRKKTCFATGYLDAKSSPGFKMRMDDLIA